jgi:hypothetical protein
MLKCRFEGKLRKPNFSHSCDSPEMFSFEEQTEMAESDPQLDAVERGDRQPQTDRKPARAPHSRLSVASPMTSTTVAIKTV